MILTIDRQALLTALTRLSGIVAKRSTIPILSDVLIEATANTVTFRATNLDIEATVRATANVEAPGSICAPADMLLQIAKNASEGADISFKLGARLAVVSGRSRYNLAVMPTGDFPTFAAVDNAQTIELAPDRLRALLGRVTFSMGTDAGRAYLQGVYFFAANGRLHALATDGLRMAHASMVADLEPFGVIVPAPAVIEILALCDAPSVTLAVSKTKIQATTPDTVLMAKLFDYQFSDYRRVIPASTPDVVSVDASSAKMAFRRVGIAIDDKARSARLTIAASLMTITARTSEAEATDEIEVEFDGELKIGVNSAHVMAAIEACGSETVQLGFAAGNGPCVVRAPDDDSFVAVIMPLKV